MQFKLYRSFNHICILRYLFTHKREFLENFSTQYHIHIKNLSIYRIPHTPYCRLAVFFIKDKCYSAYCNMCQCFSNLQIKKGSKCAANLHMKM